MWHCADIIKTIYDIIILFLLWNAEQIETKHSMLLITITSALLCLLVPFKETVWAANTHRRAGRCSGAHTGSAPVLDAVLGAAVVVLCAVVVPGAVMMLWRLCCRSEPRPGRRKGRGYIISIWTRVFLFLHLSIIWCHGFALCISTCSFITRWRVVSHSVVNEWCLCFLWGEEQRPSGF